MQTGHKTDVETVTNITEGLLLQDKLNAMFVSTKPLEITVYMYTVSYIVTLQHYIVYIVIINKISTATYAKVLLFLSLLRKCT